MSYHKNLIGKDLHEPTNTKVVNNSGSTISKFKAVTFNGFGTTLPQIVLPGPSTIRGITQTDILNTACGYITSFGMMTDLDTSGFSANDILYSDSLGNLSTTVNGTAVAQILKSDITHGIVYVFVSGGVSTTAKTKAGRVLNSGFSGSPKKTTVTFITPFGSTLYAVNITGVDVRTWAIESKVMGGFVINSNANAGLLGDVFWEAQENGEF